jgi:hypothetical protein
MMTKLSAILAGATMFLVASTSFAHEREQSFETTHPRRAEVHQRLENQRERIQAGLHEGQLTPREAARLRARDRAIRAEERARAARHGGHLTRRDQRILNRQENAVSRRIAHERHDAR